MTRKPRQNLKGKRKWEKKNKKNKTSWILLCVESLCTLSRKQTIDLASRGRYIKYSEKKVISLYVH